MAQYKTTKINDKTFTVNIDGEGTHYNPQDILLMAMREERHGFSIHRAAIDYIDKKRDEVKNA